MEPFAKKKEEEKEKMENFVRPWLWSRVSKKVIPKNFSDKQSPDN